MPSSPPPPPVSDTTLFPEQAVKTVRMVAPSLLARLGLVVALLIVFGILAAEVRAAGGWPFDYPLSAWFAARRTSFHTTLFLGATHLGDGPFLGFLATAVAVWLAVQRRFRDSGYVATVGLGALALTIGLKELFGRARPDELLRIAAASGYSFPSGHSLSSAAIYCGLVLLAYHSLPDSRRWVAPAGALLIFAVGLSRVYLGVHYASDVLAGWALGLSWAILAATPFFRTSHAPSGGAG
jgi:undecaprenyl-diphosphatase